MSVGEQTGKRERERNHRVMWSWKSKYTEALRQQWAQHLDPWDGPPWADKQTLGWQWPQDTRRGSEAPRQVSAQPKQALCTGGRSIPWCPPGPGDGLRTLPPRAPVPRLEITFWRILQGAVIQGALEYQDTHLNGGRETPERKLPNWQYGTDIIRFLGAGLPQSGPGSPWETKHTSVPPELKARSQGMPPYEALLWAECLCPPQIHMP